MKLKKNVSGVDKPHNIIIYLFRFIHKMNRQTFFLITYLSKIFVNSDLQFVRSEITHNSFCEVKNS